jgi:hypothetical protein
MSLKGELYNPIICCGFRMITMTRAVAIINFAMFITNVGVYIHGDSCHEDLHNFALFTNVFTLIVWLLSTFALFLLSIGSNPQNSSECARTWKLFTLMFVCSSVFNLIAAIIWLLADRSEGCRDEFYVVMVLTTIFIGILSGIPLYLLL